MYQISAVITSYKRETDIFNRALQSVLKQTYPILEVLVIDDNGENSSFSIELERLCSHFDKVKYINYKKNVGACAARNVGISLAKGDIIAFLDDDDEWLPTKIEKQIKIFESSSKNTGMVFCSGYVDDKKTGRKYDYYNCNSIPNPSFSYLLKYDSIGSTSQALVKKSVFDVVGGFWEELPARQDYEMWIRISQKFEIAGTNERLFIYYLHQNEQITKGKKNAFNGNWLLYKRYRKYYRKDLIARYYLFDRLFKNIYKFNFKSIYVIFRKIIIIPLWYSYLLLRKIRGKKNDV